jgi:class 3 adenylate cyclase/tetratricopeptide (TPR) repeat protein
MQCVSCNAELIDGKQFCHACGTRVAPRCAGCGATLDASFRFCPDCGLRVGDDPHAAAPPASKAAPAASQAPAMPEGLAAKIRATQGAIEGERKQVTVLFCDLVGSTAIAETLDPEEYHELLDAYLQIAFRAIYGLDGIVNQLAGDGLMALFGAPVAHEDAPQRALRAALAIHEGLAPFAAKVQAEKGITLSARIGINTGPVVVGGVGNDLKMDYSAIGDTTNLAARLEALATPGTTLVSEATHRLVRGFFQVRPVGPLEVKGKREPIAAYEVLAPADEATAITIAAERGLTPLVGRDEELATLDAAFRRLAAGQPQVVAVVGEAGSGKSRLLYEWKRRSATEGTVIFEGRCSSISQAAAYHPFVSMLRTYFGFTAVEAPDEARRKVAARLGKSVDRLEKRWPVLARFVAVSRGAPVDIPADQLKRESFEVIKRIVLAQSEHSPVVVVLEDIQWIDDGSRELLEALVAHLERARIMVLMSHRPYDHAGWRTSAALSQIVLRRLSDTDVTRIIRARTGGELPAELEQLLVAKAEGSPFFAEELVNGLVEQGYLLCDGGGCRVSRPIEEIPIPGTVQEVIAARLDRLPAPSKRAVQVAAVLGRQFSREDLAGLLIGEGVDVASALDELERRGLLHRKNLLSRDEYRFGESLTQEVAYESLLLRQRRHLHERIGTLLERTQDTTADLSRSALVAHHFTRSENRAKGLAALVRAGSDAMQLPSYRAAADFFLRAWETSAGIDDDPALRPLILQAIIGLCSTVVVFGSPYMEEAAAAAERGRGIAQQVGDPEALANVTYFHGAITMYGTREQFARGLALAEEGLSIAQRAGKTHTATRLARGLALSYVHDGRFSQAARLIDWVIAELEASGDPLGDLYVSARWVRDMTLHCADEIDEAAAQCAATYEIALSVPNRTIQSSAASTLARIHFQRGDYVEARRWADESLGIAEEIGSVGAAATAAAIALLTRLELGDPADVPRYVTAIEEGATVNSTTLTNLPVIGEALLRIGATERAARYARDLCGRAGGRLREAQVAILQGDVLGALGRHEEAGERYAEALRLGESFGGQSTLAVAHAGAAEVAAARRDAAALAHHAERALELAELLGLRHLARRVGRLGRDDTVVPPLT